MRERKKPVEVTEKAENANTHQSSLANVYNPINPCLMPQQSYQNRTNVYHIRITQCSTAGLEVNSWRELLFCNMLGHSFRECEKMKLAKEQRN